MTPAKLKELQETIFSSLDTADLAVDGMVQDHAAFLDLAASKVAAYRDSMHASSLAAHIQGIYTNLESILERAVKAYDGSMPNNSNWHVALLNAAAAASEKRPAITSIQTDSHLRELRGFRHVVRTRYGHMLDLAQTLPKLEHARLAVTLLRSDFVAFFDAVSNSK